MSYLGITVFNGLSSNSKSRPSFPLSFQVLLMCNVTLFFGLDLATHHGLIVLHTFSPLEFLICFFQVCGTSPHTISNP